MKEGEFTGLSRDILDAFAQASGHQFVYKPMPVKRLAIALEKGEIHIRYPDHARWNASEKVGKNYKYSEALTSTVSGLNFLTKNEGKPIKVIGVPLGYSVTEFRDLAQTGKVRLVESPDMQALVRMALVGRIDALYGNRDLVRHLGREAGLAEGTFAFDAAEPHTRHPYLLSSLQHPELLEQFSTWAEANKALIASIHAKYGVEM